MKPKLVVVATKKKGEAEIFYSLQGEGPHLGRPSVFLRLSRCNLYCSWCDTPYTWNWEGTDFSHRTGTKFDPEEEQQSLLPAQICELIMAYPGRALVVSGGEPLLQQDALLPLLHELRARDPSWVFDVETNGTIIPSNELIDLTQTFVVSPKLANSGVKESLRIRRDALLALLATRKSYFKFVTAEEQDLEEISALVHELGLPKERVILMPEGIEASAQEQREARVAGFALDRGWNYSERLHVRLWGDQRGT
jgi:7-carboxy-7-deazaguanine synthase